MIYLQKEKSSLYTTTKELIEFQSRNSPVSRLPCLEAKRLFGKAVAVKYLPELFEKLCCDWPSATDLGLPFGP